MTRPTRVRACACACAHLMRPQRACVRALLSAHLMRTQDVAQPAPEEEDVEDDRGGEVSGEAIVADARNVILLLQTAPHHVPPQQTLRGTTASCTTQTDHSAPCTTPTDPEKDHSTMYHPNRPLRTMYHTNRP